MFLLFLFNTQMYIHQLVYAYGFSICYVYFMCFYYYCSCFLGDFLSMLHAEIIN